MKHYIVYDPNGIVTQTGTVQDEVFDTIYKAPDETVLETTERYEPDQIYWKDGIQTLPLKPDRWSVFDTVSEAWVDPVDLKTLTRVAKKATLEINQASDHARTHYVTSITGQDSIYGRKKEEAIAYLSASPEPTDLTPYRFLAKEVGLTAPTAYELAQLWLNMDDFWTQKAADLEEIRMTAIYALSDALTANEIETIKEAAKVDLKSVVEN